MAFSRSVQDEIMQVPFHNDDATCLLKIREDSVTFLGEAKTVPSPPPVFCYRSCVKKMLPNDGYLEFITFLYS